MQYLPFPSCFYEEPPETALLSPEMRAARLKGAEVTVAGHRPVPRTLQAP